jgi:hypothetical protein
MIRSMGRQLRLVLGRDRAPDDSTGDRKPAARAPEVEFVAYAEDSLLSGHIRLNRDRLTDLLNEHDEYVLIDAICESLQDGYAVEVEEIRVPREELLLVHATGPRGNHERRQRTRALPMTIGTGPYLIHGYLHGPLGTDPIVSFRRRKPMVPLTEAWIEYASGGARQRRQVGTVVVNRELIDWIGPAVEEEMAMPDPPDLPLDQEKGPLVKDFTGELFH